MSTYEVRLESQSSPQARILTMQADSAEQARAHAEAEELKIVKFSLLPPERDVWEAGGHAKAGLPDGHAVVDLNRWDARHRAFSDALAGQDYREHVRAAERRLDTLRSRIEIAPNGKVRAHSLTPVAKARLLGHLQSEPYAVTDVREVDQTAIDAQRLVRLARKLLADHDPRYDPAGWQRIIDELAQMGFPTAVVTAQIHGVAALDNDDGSAPVVWASNTINAALLTGYTADPDTHHFWSSVSSTEITGPGYTATGVALGTKTHVYDTVSDQTRLGAADSQWTGSTLSATDAAIVNRTPSTDATRQVMGSIDFGGTVSTTSGTFTISWDATSKIVMRDYT